MLAVLCIKSGLNTIPVFAAGKATDIAIVVRPDVPVDNLTFADLFAESCWGDRQYWSS